MLSFRHYFILLILGLLLTSPSYAQLPDYYVGIDVGMLHADVRDQAKPYYADEYSTGSIYLGTRIYEDLTFELGYFRTTEASKDFTYLNVIPITNSHYLQGGYADFVGNYEFLPHVSVIGSLGLAYIHSSPTLSVGSTPLDTDIDSDYFAPKFGLGFGVDLSDHVALRSMANYIPGDTDIFTYTAGIQYRFNLKNTLKRW